jgi:hypothetical protein
LLGTEKAFKEVTRTRWSKRYIRAELPNLFEEAWRGYPCRLCWLDGW